MISGFFVLLGTLTGESALAANCHPAESLPTVQPVNWVNTITVPSNGAVGDVLATADWTFNGHTGYVYCDNAQSAALTSYWGIPAYGRSLTAVSGMSPYTLELDHAGSGIGVRIYLNGRQLTDYQSGLAGSVASLFGGSSVFYGPGYVTVPKTTYHFELVRTAVSPVNPLTVIPTQSIGGNAYVSVNTGGFLGEVGFAAYNLRPINVVWQTSTCTIIAGDVNKSVTLQRVKSSDFNNSPGTGDVPFTLTAANCQNATSATFTFSGTPDSTNPVLFKSTGDAAGVGVRIYPASDSGQTIGANGTNNVQTVAVSGGQAVLSLGAQYYKTGTTVGAGQVTTRATVTMSYN
ncbi:fimbrial protein [Dyella koreensis]|uniref:Type 1 fimbrial protein n=1 Tax=Dyella koreensis TaxID=311235 RepID=A0ABW8JZI1_9GAMM